VMKQPLKEGPKRVAEYLRTRDEPEYIHSISVEH